MSMGKNLKSDVYSEKNNEDITVVVITYNPIPEKVFITLNSILLQKGVNIKIVIADDGSKNNLFSNIKDYFKKHNFNDYVLIDNSENHGTVKNLYSAIKIVTTPYVKDISPGDCLYGEYVLHDWLLCAKNNSASLVFSDTVCYTDISEYNVRFVKNNASPQNLKSFRKGGESLRTVYLLYDDLCCGASILFKTEVLKKYLELIIGKVIYAEDHVIRLMVYKNEISFWFENNSVLYETGAGISTSKNVAWSKKLYNDQVSADTILYSWLDKNRKFDRKLNYMIKAHSLVVKHRWFLKLLRLRKGLCLFIKNGFKLRKTNVVDNKTFLQLLLNY